MEGNSSVVDTDIITKAVQVEMDIRDKIEAFINVSKELTPPFHIEVYGLFGDIYYVLKKKEGFLRDKQIADLDAERGKGLTKIRIEKYLSREDINEAIPVLYIINDKLLEKFKQ